MIKRRCHWSQTHHMPEQKRSLWVHHRIKDNINHLARTPHQSPSSAEGSEWYMMEQKIVEQ